MQVLAAYLGSRRRGHGPLEIGHRPAGQSRSPGQMLGYCRALDQPLAAAGLRAELLECPLSAL